MGVLEMAQLARLGNGFIRGFNLFLEIIAAGAAECVRESNRVQHLHPVPVVKYRLFGSDTCCVAVKNVCVCVGWTAIAPVVVCTVMPF